MPSMVTTMTMLLDKICRQTLPSEMKATCPFGIMAGVGTSVGGIAVGVGGSSVGVGGISIVLVGRGGTDVGSSGSSVAVGVMVAVGTQACVAQSMRMISMERLDKRSAFIGTSNMTKPVDSSNCITNFFIHKVGG